MVCAFKDPVGTDLQRIQIVNGWADHEGVTHGQVYEVAGNPGDGAGVEVDVTEGTCDPVRAGFNELCEVLVTELPGGEKLLRTAGGLIGAAGVYLFTKAAP